MNRWLIKTEPGVYSFDDLVEKGRDVWDGVANTLAQRNIRAIRKGDEILVYHTGENRAIVGMARAVSGPYPDPRADIGSMAAFDLEPVRKFKKPITLDQMRRDKTFANWELLRISRLSVMLVPEEIWARVMKLSGSK